MPGDSTPRRPVRRVHTGRGDHTLPAATTPPKAQPSAARLPSSEGNHSRPSTQPPPGIAAEHMARLKAELAERANGLAQRARQIDDSLTASVAEERERSRAEVDEARRRAEEVRADAVNRLRTERESREQELAAEIESLVVAYAPGPFGADPTTDWGALDLGFTGAPPLVRRGSAHGTAALYPLFHDRGWYLEGRLDATLQEIQTVLLRAVAGLPLRHLRLDVYDPRLEGRLGGFAPLRSANASSFPVPSTSANGFRAVLEDVTSTAATNAEMIATEHVQTLGELWSRRGIPTGEYRIVVVLNYPDGIDRETQSQLTRLAQSGGPNGVSLLIQHDKKAEPTDDSVRSADLAKHLRKSRVEKTGQLLLSDYPADVVVELDPPAPDRLMNDVLSHATARSSSDTGPVIPLSDLIGADAENPWQGDGTEGLEATIARVGQRNLGISLRTKNPAVSNILVGGAVGQGKSNLLLDIVYALASRYSPDDLELHLLDFKRGLEFRRFAADQDGINWLPHARVLSLESDRAFGVAVLRHVVRELDRRATLFKETAATEFDDYRMKSGQVLPRLLLIIDEFQVLFDGDDPLVDEAVALLESISRQGRASGVHLLLSSQTTTGVSGLRTKGESIFAQFPLRISLKNTVNESEAILSNGNKAAADLTYRGEVIVNRNFGHDPEGSNERAICAYADPDYVSELQSRLWRLRPDGEVPMLFVSTDFAEWPRNLPAATHDGTGVGWVGRPVEVTNEPVTLLVDEDVDQTVAIVGADERLAIPVLSGLTRTLGASLRPDRVIVIDLTAQTEATAGQGLATTLGELEERGVAVERYGRRDGAAGLTGSARATLDDPDSKTLVIGLGWQRWTALDDMHDLDPDDEDNHQELSLREMIQDLSQHGALNGVFLIAWWTRLHSLQEQLGYSYQGVRHFITVKLGLDEYRSLTSHSEPAIDGYPRVGHIDRASDGGPSIAVPFLTVEGSP